MHLLRYRYSHYEVPGGSHYPVRQSADISTPTTDFTLAALGAEAAPLATGAACTRLPSRVRPGP
ncbi:hypothetical protein ABZW30_32850 [Kitasatospora sp. NPDC004669]|uniref:hypothetical protein n=1 Tax=Kitasatospora sp. NPDC004669 TaxID=3154555 RepID=UPI0033A3EB11